MERESIVLPVRGSDEIESRAILVTPLHLYASIVVVLSTLASIVVGMVLSTQSDCSE